MKKILNDNKKVVEDVINGLCKSHPNKLERIDGYDVVVTKNLIEGKVGLVCGGGSGHEPAHAGYVGKGMLDAAVLGGIFSAPTPDQILEAIKAVDTGAGVLLIVKNYSGDIMNFEMAMELAEFEGIKCAKVVVDDDVAVENSTYTTGRRGIAGTIYMHKILGQKALEMSSLEELETIGNDLNNRIYTMGLSVSSCVNPEVGHEMFEMGDDEMEVGMGIHGEPGIYRSQLKTSKEIVKILLDKIFEEIDYNNESTLVLINGLNSTTMMELYVVASDVHDYLAAKSVNVYDTKVGDYMTSLDMAGISITLVKAKAEEIVLYDAPTGALSW